MVTARITGPLRTWYDLHEALAYDVAGLAHDARSLEAGHVEAFTDRLAYFDQELRLHSGVEDAILFAAIRRAGGVVNDHLLEDHHAEQLLLYDVRTALLEARTFPAGDAAMTMVADELDEIRDSLRAHFEIEEEEVLPQVPLLFDDDEQGRLLRTILSSVPDDPRLQPWVVRGLSPEHRATRLRNLSAALPPAAFEVVLRQIRDGVSPEVWDDIREHTPELAARLDA